jgi:regulator of replication initiation timing
LAALPPLKEPSLKPNNTVVVQKTSGAKEIIERIQKLESEKASLLMEREELKKQLDERAATLQSELGTIRYELSTLRTLLGNGAAATVAQEPKKKRKRKRKKKKTIRSNEPANEKILH